MFSSTMECKGALYQELAQQLQQELAEGQKTLIESSSTTREDRFCLHRVCFNKLVDCHSAYKPLLSKIKAAYEECVEAIKKAQKELSYLSDKLASSVTQPLTLRNYKNRVDELQDKICVLKSKNQRLLLRVQAMGCSEEDEQEENAQSSSTLGIPSPHLLYNIPGLTLEQQTDANFLIRKVVWLKNTAKRLRSEHSERFVGKEHKADLLYCLRLRETYREELADKREQLKLRVVALKVAVAIERDNRRNMSSRRRESAFATVASAFQHTVKEVKRAGEVSEEEDTEAQSPVEGMHDSPEPEREENNLLAQEEFGFFLAESDDPKNEREAKFILEYIEHFDKLIQAGNLEEAALVAAHSPKGVLRTQETFQKFKEHADTKIPKESQSLLLGYWEAVLATVSLGCQKPSKWETLACARCALKQGRHDLLVHWLAQKQLAETCELALEISAFCRCTGNCACGLNAMAQVVYENVGNFKESIKCLIRQGRFCGALKYGLTHPQVKSRDIINALSCFPEKTAELIQSSSTPEEVFSDIFTVEEIVSLLINLDDQFIDVEDVRGAIRRVVGRGHQFQVTALIEESDVYDITGNKKHLKWMRLYHLFEDLGRFDLAEALLAHRLVTNVIREAWRVYVQEIFLEYL